MKRAGLLLLLVMILAAGAACAGEAVSPGTRGVVDNPDPKDKLFLRSGPDKGAAPLGLYYNGTPLEVVECAPDAVWAEVRIGPLAGYMMREYLAFGEDCTRVRNMNPIVYVDAQGALRAPLFALQDRASECMGSYPNGMAVTVMGVGPEWIHVWVDGSTGFMPACDLSSVDEAAEVMLSWSGFVEYPYDSKPVGPGDHMVYQQTVNVHPSVPPLVLSFWGSYDASGTLRLDVARAERDGELLQEMPLRIENGDWSQYAQDFITMEDVNFDGYLDFRVCRSVGAYNHYYDYWTWDSENGRFYANEAFARLDAYPIFDPQEKRISCGSKDGAATFYEFEYQVAYGLPMLVERRDIRYGSGDNRTVTLWQRQGGKLVQVREWREK